jgi:hypothetical protein
MVEIILRCGKCLHFDHRSNRCFNELRGGRVPMPPYAKGCKLWNSATGAEEAELAVRLFVAGFTYGEIAERLNVSRHAIAGLLNRRGVTARHRPPAAQDRAKRHHAEVQSANAALRWKRREDPAG